MAGPIGFGVVDGRRRAARGKAMPPPAPGRSWRRFVLITFALSWLAAAGSGGTPAGSELLWVTLYYAGVMAWPPLVAMWLTRWADGGVAPEVPTHEPARGHDVAIAIALAAAVVIGAVVLTSQRLDAAALATIAAIVVVLAAQALSEEHGWRGGSLDWARARWGARLGLVIHGGAWGLWYAPLFVVSAQPVVTDATGLAAFAGLCVAAGVGVGVLLGWIRLRTRSVLPSAIANAALTILAGLAFSPGATG